MDRDEAHRAAEAMRAELYPFSEPSPAPPSRCGAKTSRGGTCRRWPRRGATVCDSHGGAAPQVARRAAVRAEVLAWGLDAATVDPGETLLRLVSQSARRAALYADLLERQFDAEGGEPSGDPARWDSIPEGVRALVGHVYASDGEGGRIATHEAIRGLAQLEAQERDRCARFAKLALDAGIAERQVRLAEQQGALIAGVLQRVLDALELTPEQRRMVAVVAPRELRAVAG